MGTRERIVRLLGSAPESSGPGVRPPLLLAPMATITHAGFRTLVSEFGGCDLYFTEMISAEALIGGTPFESYYLSLEPEPERTIYQVIGYSAESILGAARRLAETPCAGIDLNLGCSAPHIVRKGGGIAWMQKPAEASGLLARLRATLADKTLSVKMRLGPRDDAEQLVSLALAFQDAGVDFLTLHPKRQKEGSDRSARWAFVSMLRRELAVPVVGNGGITGWESYQVRTRAGKSDGPLPEARPVMIGRGAVRAPWLFAYLRNRESGKESMEVDLHATLESFFVLLEQHQPREFWSSRARRIYPYFFRNVKFGHSTGARLGATHDYASARDEALRYLSDRPETAHHTEQA